MKKLNETHREEKNQENSTRKKNLDKKSVSVAMIKNVELSEVNHNNFIIVVHIQFH